MSEKNYSKELEKALKFIENSDQPVNISMVGEEVDLNVMFLSGALSAFWIIGALKMTELGKQHIFAIKDEAVYTDILNSLES